MTGQWWYAKEGLPVGPVTEQDLEQQIRAGTVGAETQVWCSTMPQWAAARTVEALAPLLAAAPTTKADPSVGTGAGVQPPALPGGAIGGSGPVLTKTSPVPKTWTDKAGWWYSRDGKPQGPFTMVDLQAMARSGTLTTVTRIWTRALPNWVRADQIADLQPLLQVGVETEELATASSGQAPLPPVTPVAGVRTDPGNAGPWSRFWARQIDFCLFGISLIVLMELLGLDDPMGMGIVFGILLLPVYLLFETMLCGLSGTTAGKWIFGITVRDTAGQELTLGATAQRLGKLWVMGIGLGVPLISFVTMIVALVRSGDGLPNGWNMRNGTAVVVLRQDGIGNGRKAAGIGLAVLLLLGWYAFSVRHLMGML